MALLFADGFDHYGTDTGNMLDGVYADIGGTINTTTFATGTASFASGGDTGGVGEDMTRFVLSTAIDKMGICAKVYFPSLPSINTTDVIFDFLTTTSTRAQISVFVTSTGALSFHRGQNYGLNGDTGTVVAESDPCIIAAAWSHVEVQVYIHDTLGWIRAYVNGVKVYEIQGIDTAYDSTKIAQVGICNRPYYGLAPIYAGGHYMDDLYTYDFVGSSTVDTDFVPTTDGSGVAIGNIGELQVMYLPPNGDTASTAWGRSSGASDFDMVDETNPNDTDYIYSTTAGDLSEFELTDLPPEITYVRGLMLLGRLSKADAGVAYTKFGMKSVAATSDATARPITVEPTYWKDFMNIDPNSGARWTRASLNAAKFRITRTI